MSNCKIFEARDVLSLTLDIPMYIRACRKAQTRGSLKHSRSVLRWSQRLLASMVQRQQVGARQDASLKRANKNRPQQLSSKRAVSTFRVAPGLNIPSASNSRDPRFDGVSKGEFKDHQWRQAYSFVFDKQQEEIKEQKKILSQSKTASKLCAKGGSAKRRAKGRVLSAEDSEEIKREINRKNSQVLNHQRAVEEQKSKAAARKKEVELIKEGKQPFYAKKSVLKEEQLVKRYHELKEKGQLDNFMAKKRKKVDSKQRRALPGEKVSWDSWE